MMFIVWSVNEKGALSWDKDVEKILKNENLINPLKSLDYWRPPAPTHHPFF